MTLGLEARKCDQLLEALMLKIELVGERVQAAVSGRLAAKEMTDELPTTDWRDEDGMMRIQKTTAGEMMRIQMALMTLKQHAA